MSSFSLFGVNLSGAEYDPGGTLEGTNYIYPSDAEIDYYASKGMTVIRLPFLLERVEPVAGGPLSTTELGYIDNVVNYAASKGIDVILDPHDYGNEYGTVIGTTAASNATFANFWGELAGHFASASNVLFGLMNEPNAVTPTQWLVSANAAIAAIRAAGATTQQILVPGTDWDGADTWVSSGNAQVLGSGIVDPSHNFAFEVHQYLDADGSGTSSTVVSTTIGIERLTAITQWAEATGNKLFLGEFGVASDPTSLTALNNMLGYMAQHTDVWEGGTYWAGGPWLGSYMYSIESTDGIDKPQMKVLQEYSIPGAVDLAAVNNNFSLWSAGADVSLSYAGAAVVAGQFGNIAPIAAVQTASGYDIAWQIPDTDQFTFWAVDNNGNYVSNLTGLVSGTSYAAESLETIFGQDLNGDGTIGPTTTLIQTDGASSLTQVANEYFLYAAGGTSGPSLNYGGSPVTAGEFGSIAPIGAVKTASGYDVAWKIPGSEDFTFWTTDSNGNYTSNLTGWVTGNSFALESLESIFGQDLNHDGTIGVTSSLVQTDGATSLLAIANNYYLYSSGSGPELSYGGAPVTAGEFGNIAPVGAVKTATGYDIAWQVPGSESFTFWTTDANGNYTSNLTGWVTGNSFALESLESIFGQDFNADGTIGVTASLIQTDASTSLLAIANNYYFYINGTGPELKDGGTPVTAGEFGNIVPVGAVQTATGYDIAWQVPGTENFTFWTANADGNYTSNLTGWVTGTDPTLKALEATFYQDVNGDGYIDSPTTVIDVTGHVALGLSTVAQPSAIEANATLELIGADSSSVTFEGSTGTLVLDHSSMFTGEVSNFTGNGNLSGSDQLDLRDIAFGTGTTETFNGNATGGTLTVEDSQGHTASIHLLGNYTSSTFTLSSDGHGGTVVVDPPVAQDRFVFKEPASTSPMAMSDFSKRSGLIAESTSGSIVSHAGEAFAGQIQSHFQLTDGTNDSHFENHSSAAFANMYLASLNSFHLIA
jgi:Cellulase (glycosyl hydrolase family 5)/Tryptophan-rich Synechocystis species C-terminal domain